MAQETVKAKIRLLLHGAVWSGSSLIAPLANSFTQHFQTRKFEMMDVSIPEINIQGCPDT